MYELKCKRIYEPAKQADGFRILVDRLWPRGIKKEDAKIDLWAKDIAPSTDLRKFFAHDPKKYASFKKAYREELTDNPAAENFKDLCLEKIKDQRVTLLYGAKDEKYNHALVLKTWLEEQM